MKKTTFIFSAAIIALCFTTYLAFADSNEEMITITVPASEIKSIDVKYKGDEPSKADKAIETSKEIKDKTVKATKKTLKKTKSYTDKTISETKSTTQKTVEAAKNAAQKTVDKTKEIKDKTVDSTKEFVDNLNPNKVLTAEELETEATVRTLKNEKNELKSAYNSRIKDLNAQIKAAEVSTTLSDVERQNKIHTLEQQKEDLQQQKESAISKYNLKIISL